MMTYFPPSLIQVDCRRFEEQSYLDSNGKRIKKKQTTIRTRKSIGGIARNSKDSEDEFKPTKAAPKKRAPVQTKTVKDESDNDDGFTIAAPMVAAARGKRKVSAKHVFKDESESDFDAVGKPTTRKVATASSSATKKAEIDEDGNEVKTPNVAGKGMEKAKPVAAAPKRKRFVLFLFS